MKARVRSMEEVEFALTRAWQERPPAGAPSFALPPPSLFPQAEWCGYRNQRCVSPWPPEGRSFSWIFGMNLGWGEWTVLCPHLLLSFPLISFCVPSSTSSSMAGCLTAAGVGHGEVSWSNVGGTCWHLNKYFRPILSLHLSSCLFLWATWSWALIKML